MNEEGAIAALREEIEFLKKRVAALEALAVQAGNLANGLADLVKQAVAQD